jgi:HD superfamily phosphohydrolase
MADVIHRDEIHGDVRYDPLAVALLDTPTLQRLGRVYQLGYGHLVYRGGTHTRLSHAMGTYHTASCLVAALRRNYEGAAARPPGAVGPEIFLPRSPVEAKNHETANQLSDRWTVLRQLVAWAGLLHDVGHIPLGHTLEDEFDGIFEKHDAFVSPRLRHLWLGPDSEIQAVMRRTDLYPSSFARLGITDGGAVASAVMLICTWKEKVDGAQRSTFQEILRAHLSDPERAKGIAPDLLAAMDAVCPALFSPYMADIVANTISADYLDYLRRDPHNLGLDVLRDDRVVSRFWVGLDHRDQARMALALVDRRGKPRLDTCTGVVELVRQRYRFAEIVYYHRTKVAASAMLAKVFHLVGPPPEIPAGRSRLTVRDADSRVGEVFDLPDSRRRGALNELVEQCKPSSLLDPEIGDEGLGQLLRERAVEQLEEALKSFRGGQEAEARNRAADAVRAVALLDQLARRELYKTAAMISPEQFPAISGLRRSPPEEHDRELAGLIEKLRSDDGERSATEAAMEAAAGWTAGTILIYVPGRKVQAKGIETGALADGKVVTLGVHPAVKDQVAELGRRYADLWRLIVLVHPGHAADAIGLSAAFDALIARQYPKTSLSDHAVVDALDDCCWFPYQVPGDRVAAHRYLELTGIEPRAARWQHLRAYGRRGGRCTSDELAIGAALIHRVAVRVNDDEQADALVAAVGDPPAVKTRVDELAKLEVTSASRQGELDADPETRAVQRALQSLADELIRGRDVN